jgi:hypothetical protein
MRSIRNHSHWWRALAVFGLSICALGLAAVNAEASSEHVVNSACFLTSSGTTKGGPDIQTMCSFTMDNNFLYQARFFTHAGTGPDNYVWGQLTNDFDAQFSANQLPSYSPQMNFRLTCSTAMNNWTNSQEIPTGWVYMGANYHYNTGALSPNFYCPSNKPIIQFAFADTKTIW